MPSCSQCPEPAVALLRYAGRHLCREHFLRFFGRRAKMELSRQGRLPKGRVAVALSGGKDSVSVLHFVQGLVRERPDVEVVAVTVDEGIAGYRESALDICRQVTQEWGVEWRVVRTRDLGGYDIDDFAAGRAGPEAEGSLRPACGPCGVFRRFGVNRLAREVGAGVVVTGHNLDDQAQTVLMNVLNGDVERLGRLAPHGREVAGLVPRRIPFRTIPEKEVLLYALLQGLPLHHEAECPYAARSHRFAMRDVLQGLEERSPGTRHAIVRFQDRLAPALEILQEGGAGVGVCPGCGEATSGASCRVCAWREPSVVEGAESE